MVTWDDPKYGGTVAWNQLYNKTGNASGNGVTFTNVNGTITVTGVATGNSWYTLNTSAFPANHKYLLMGGNSASLDSTAYMYARIGDGVYNRLIGGKTACIVSPLLNVSIQASTGYDGDTNPLSFTPQIFDITQMFGSTIADYIYTLESGTAGAGVAWFKKLFPSPYYAYNTGETTCVSAVNGDPYNHHTTALGRTVYGGVLDVVSGELVVTDGYIASYNGETLPSTWISDRDEYASGTTPTIGAEVVYELATPQTYQLTPQQIDLLLGTNHLWSDGEITLTYGVHPYYNPTPFESKPLIKVTGTGTLTVNGVQIAISATPTTIDCELMEAYNGTTSRNSDIVLTPNKFPVLKPGNNTITLGSGITKLEITPRWWRI